MYMSIMVPRPLHFVRGFSLCRGRVRRIWVRRGTIEVVQQEQVRANHGFPTITKTISRETRLVSSSGALHLLTTSFTDESPQPRITRRQPGVVIVAKPAQRKKRYRGDIYTPTRVQVPCMGPWDFSQRPNHLLFITITIVFAVGPAIE